MTRLIREQDFDFIYRLYMHPATNPFLLYELMDEETFKPIFGDLLLKNIIYIYEQDAVPAGMFKLIPATHRSAHIVYVGGLAVEPTLMGRGLGGKMMEEIIALCKEKGFLRIELSTYTGNEKAIRLYEKAGFQQEGVLRKYTHLKSEGRFVDEVMMSYVVA
ncbi:GNAT family protein [Paraflavitalea sp. CAU 1676]|uniref:GNAT family N-acetyltransferase n=1 Tax=Paraflavitalea sp. CAU 1676 TaxID=3032598 RepID=UPI0023DCD407|nr:GNAT family protein [Paraflavitalea sp. CAU 1676]MDF2191527.1 GNAT family protein [Paraflavitalea sp. CAU 1676]